MNQIHIVYSLNPPQNKFVKQEESNISLPPTTIMEMADILQNLLKIPSIQP